MGLQDRDWYKEEVNRRSGSTQKKTEARKENYSQKPKANIREGKTERIIRGTRISEADKARLTALPPRETVTAARQYLSTKRQKKKELLVAIIVGLAIIGTGIFLALWVMP